MVEPTKRQKRVLEKRARVKAASDAKIKAFKEKAEADKSYKVFVSTGPEDKNYPTVKAVLVRAKSKKAAMEKIGKKAFRAFEVAEDYKLPVAKPEKSEKLGKQVK